ncbi:MAG TPA: hypothetical protein VLT45_20600 [Kofleriaceae bacterium]|nr:hypothetical protein [Kofleriaceae bacterium]
MSSERAEVIPGYETYAPQIQVLLDGKDVTSSLLDDVIDLKVTQQVDQLTGFSMQLANHAEFALSGDKKRDGKYRHSDDDKIQMLTPVSISMGYVGRLEVVFLGEVTMLQPGFPSSGLPTFTVTGTDRLQRLRNAKPSKDTKREFENQADWEIAKIVAQRHNLGYSTRSVTKGTKNKHRSQKNMDDATFLLHLATLHEYEASVVIEDDKQKLYFGPPTDKRSGEKVTQLKLQYGESLISFTPRLGLSNQVSAVTVRSFDSRTKKTFVYKATHKDLPQTGGSGMSGPERVDKQQGGKEEVIVNRPVQSQQEAKDLAIEILTEVAYRYMTGSGEAMGDPRIFPGVSLELSGLGEAFNGVYYVEKAEHSFGAQGYTTSFDVKRLKDNHDKGTKRG